METAAAIAAVVGTVAKVAAPIAGLASAGLAISGARQQAAGMRVQAQQQDLLVKQEELRGREQANQVREALLRTLATQRAQYAAAGIALDGGTPQTVADASAYEAERELAIAAGNTASRAGAGALNARLLRERATSTSRAGIISGGLSLFDAADRLSSGVAGWPRAERTGVAGPPKDG